MKILDWFDSCTEKERQAAKSLISAGEKAAAGGYKPLCDSFPGLLAVAGHSRTQAYDYSYTVAFAIMALIGANMYFPKSRRQSTTRAISTELEKWRKAAYKKDGLSLLNLLNANNGFSTEVNLGRWIIDQLSRDIRDNKYKSAIQDLKRQEELMSALGHQIMTQAAEAAVECFLEDKEI